MNNPLAQKAQYYLNESHRLSEELKNETEYSELLENILSELLSEEELHTLLEFRFKGKGSLTHKPDGTRRNPEQIAHLQKRFGQIIKKGVNAQKKGDFDTEMRAANSLAAAGFTKPHTPGRNTTEDDHRYATHYTHYDRRSWMQRAMSHGDPIQADTAPATPQLRATQDYFEDEKRKGSLERRIKANPNYHEDLAKKAKANREDQSLKDTVIQTRPTVLSRLHRAVFGRIRGPKNSRQKNWGET